ncbi:hypothetical protein E4U33_007507, partial [Claviceps sp. LM78 group G4]
AAPKLMRATNKLVPKGGHARRYDRSISLASPAPPSQPRLISRSNADLKIDHWRIETTPFKLFHRYRESCRLETMTPVDTRSTAMVNPPRLASSSFCNMRPHSPLELNQVQRYKARMQYREKS